MFDYLNSESFKVLLNFLKIKKRYALLGSLFLVLSVLLLLPTPMITMYLIDTIIPNKDMEMVFVLFGGLILLLIIKWLCEFYQSLFFARYNNIVILHIQRKLVFCIQGLTASKRKNYHTGYLMSRVIDDPNNLDGMLAKSIVTLVKDILIFIFGIVLLCYLNITLFAITIVLVPFYFISLKYYSSQIHNVSRNFLESQALFSKKIQESISMIDTLIINVATKKDQILIVKSISDRIRAYMNREITTLKSLLVTGFISGIGPISVICIGATFVMNETLTLGELVAFNTYIGLLYGPTNRFVGSYVSIKKSLSAWERIFKILNSHEYKNNKSIKHNISGSISIKNLYVSSGGFEILKNINIDILKGQTIALVGKSGAGKSTLCRTIMSLEDEYRGDIQYDGISIYKICKEYLRRQIAFIEQEPKLFSSTLFENLVLGNENASKSSVINACKSAGIHDFIMSLEKGYDTIASEKGVNFSIGQKQRIAIARAILKKPNLIILDEPTSNLDAENERMILENLNTSFPDITKIIIAHNLSVIQNSDMIFVIDNGEIVCFGTHSQLLSSKGSIYYSMWSCMKEQGNKWINSVL